jgi:hypothetical protein
MSSQLITSMGEDDAMPSLLETRIDATLGSEFSLEPVDSPNKQQSTVMAKRYGPLWWDTFPEDECYDLLTSRIMLGVGIAVLDWDRGGSEWRARLRTLDPQFLRFDQFTNKYIFHAQEGELEVNPGDGTWILLAAGRRGWLRSAVRSLAIPWIAKQLTIRDWNRYNERHGLPIVKAMAPAIASESDRDDFWDDLQDLNSEIVAQLPTHLDENGARFDLELLEAKDGSWQTFKEHIARCDERFTIYLKGANLGTQVDGQGSRAAAEVHRGVELSKAKADATKFSTELRKQGLWPIISANVEGFKFEITPWPKWQVEPEEDNKLRADVLSTVSTAIDRMVSNGAPIDVDLLLEQFGVPVLAPVDGKPLGRAGQQLFQYHLAAGVMTVNEVRARLGLEPVPWGKEPATLKSAVPPDGFEPPPPQLPPNAPRALPPKPDDGDEEDEDTDEEESDDETEAAAAEAGRLRAGVSELAVDDPGDADASALVATKDSDGQLYADDVAAHMQKHAARELAVTVAAMVSAVRSAGSYAEAKQLIVAKYGKLKSPAELAQLTEAALVMCQLGGHTEIQEDAAE